MAIFLGKNGELTMGNKTPVTILQETLQKTKQTPHYELIYNGVGTNDPLFMFRVCAEGLTAEGSGKSKKEAKHNAAREFLRRMKPGNAVVENADVEDLEDLHVASPYTGALKENFIGMLEGICVVNKLPFPAYIQISEIGPPHARVFTMKCQLSSLMETAVARTKKQAKHLAAKQMIERLKDILGDRFIPYVEKMNFDLCTLQDLDKPVDAEVKMPESHHYQPDLAMKPCDLHNVFHLQEEVLPPAFIELTSKGDEFFENSYDALCKILESIGGMCTTTAISSEQINTAHYEINSHILGIEIRDDCVNVDRDLEEATSLESADSEASSLSDSLELLGIPVLDLQDSTEDVSTPHLESVVTKSQYICERLKQLELSEQDTSSEVVRVIINVECQQGKWRFMGISNTYEKALRKASFWGLEFMRIMAIPPVNR